MIIKGGARGNGAQLGRYLVTPGQNERIQVIEVRGTVAGDVPGAVREIDAVSLCTRCTKPLYHASVNTPATERLTPEQRAIAVDRLEAALGFTGQPRVVVVHEKQGREHTHIVWSRTDIERERAIPIDHNFRKHELVARELEREFGHARVQGAHIEREGRARPKRTPRHYELHQAARGGMKPDRCDAGIITEIYQRSDSGRAFAKGLAEAGFILARGDRRDFVVIDAQGGTHSLARCIEGATAKDVRARLADLDPRTLPSVQEAKQIQRARQAPGLDRANEQPRGRAQDAGQAANAPAAAARAGRNSCSSSDARAKACAPVTPATVRDRKAEGPAPGAVAGPQDDKPRVSAKRGTQGGAAGAVWGEFRRAAGRPLSLPIVHASGFRSAPAGDGDTRGEFRAQASTVSASVSSAVDAGGQFAGGGDDELGNLLSAIADDVQRMAAGYVSGDRGRVRRQDRLRASQSASRPGGRRRQRVEGRTPGGACDGPAIGGGRSWPVDAKRRSGRIASRCVLSADRATGRAENERRSKKKGIPI